MLYSSTDGMAMPLLTPSLLGRKKAREIVTQFHKINDEIAVIQNDGSMDANVKKEQLGR